MKMRQCLIVILTLLMLNALTLALNTRQVKPESSTIIVPDDYATIQAAITAARSVWGNPSSGYTIFVRAGIYFENIVINMSNHYLTITGENADTTIIDGANAGQAVVTIKNVSLNSFANFTVKNSDTNAPGIYAYNSTGRITNNIVKDNFQGINIQDSFEIEIVNNNFVSNTVGINVSYAIPIPRGNNFIHHNHFIDNIQQAHVTGYPFFSDSWDDGYPSGGNYWSDYPGVDVFSGPNQDQPGSDGIGDTPYVIDTNNQDRYPLWTSPPSVVTATVNIDPDTLNLKSVGEWITCYIEPPAGSNASDIDVSTIKLNNTIAAETHPTDIGDEDGDGVPDLMVKFDRAMVINFVESNLDWATPERTKPLIYAVNLTVTGSLDDGTPFEGTDTIRVLQFLKGHPQPR